MKIAADFQRDKPDCACAVGVQQAVSSATGLGVQQAEFVVWISFSSSLMICPIDYLRYKD